MELLTLAFPVKAEYQDCQFCQLLAENFYLGRYPLDSMALAEREGFEAVVPFRATGDGPSRFTKKTREPQETARFGACLQSCYLSANTA